LPLCSLLRFPLVVRKALTHPLRNLPLLWKRLFLKRLPLKKPRLRLTVCLMKPPRPPLKKAPRLLLMLRLLKPPRLPLKKPRLLLTLRQPNKRRSFIFAATKKQDSSPAFLLPLFL
jgi:hypothetical protein